MVAEEKGRTERVWDDITGKEMDWDMVVAARMEEMEEVRKHGVYEKVLIQECINRTGKKPLKVRWVDVNKGDDVTPEYRSRLVAKEIRVDKRFDLFAATPRREAIKGLLSSAVTEGIGYFDFSLTGGMGYREVGRGGMKMDSIYAKRAYYQADALWEVCITLPPGDEE